MGILTDYLKAPTLIDFFIPSNSVVFSIRYTLHDVYFIRIKINTHQITNQVHYHQEVFARLMTFALDHQMK